MPIGGSTGSGRSSNRSSRSSLSGLGFESGGGAPRSSEPRSSSNNRRVSDNASTPHSYSHAHAHARVSGSSVRVSFGSSGRDRENTSPRSDIDVHLVSGGTSGLDDMGVVRLSEGFGLHARDTGENVGVGMSAGQSNDERTILKLRNVRQKCMDKRLFPSALYWGEKALAASKGNLDDVYWVGHLYLETSQHTRVVHLMEAHDTALEHVACRYLLAKAHSLSESWDDVLAVLDEPHDPLHDGRNYSFGSWNPDSAIHLLRGEAYKAKDRVNPAIECFKEAVRVDPYCHEAFQHLTSNYYLNPQEEQSILNQLLDMCDDEGKELVRFLYGGILKKTDINAQNMLPAALSCLSDDVDVHLARARAYYDHFCYRKCFEITSKILHDDPYHLACLALHVDVLVALSKKNDLFLIAHKLVETSPKSAFSCKATTIDKLYGAAYLAFGHSFAVEGEHDQAMAAYCTAARLLKGSHLPYLYRGLEYLYTHQMNVPLARENLCKAQELRPDDPQTLHELGICYFREERYQESVASFDKALVAYKEQIGSISDPEGRAAIEATLVCLGQTYRKQHLYEKAAVTFDQAITLNANQPTTYAALAFTRHLQDRVHEAIDLYHVALSLKSDDAFCLQMLNIAVKEVMSGPHDEAREEKLTVDDNSTFDSARFDTYDRNNISRESDVGDFVQRSIYGNTLDDAVNDTSMSLDESI
eukprot:CFRG1712T1